MSSAYLKSKIEERAGLADLMTGILDRCAEKAEQPTTEERAQLDKWGGQVKVLDAEIAELETRFNADRRFEQVLNRMSEGEERAERRAAAQQEQEPEERPMSVAEAFLSSEAFTEYRMRGDGARYTVDDFFGFEERAAMGGLEERAPIKVADAKAQTWRWPGLPELPITTPFLDLVNRERVSTGSFDYLTWGPATGVALVAEAALKPEVSLAPTVVTASLDTYAGWVQITRQALEDVPRLRAQVELRLRQNLATVLEGVAVDAIEAAALTPVAGFGLEAVRGAIGSLQATNHRPNAIALNPADFAALDVSAMSLTFNGPTAFGNFWGLTPVPVPGLTAGTAIVGDFNRGLTWFDRGTTDLYMSDSHADTFIRNVFTLLAEARAAFKVTDEGALAAVTITDPAAVQATAASK